MQAIEQEPGALVFDEAGGQRVQHLHAGHLHGVQVLQYGQDEMEGLAARLRARHTHAAAQRPQMKAAKLAPAQRGTLAVGAVFFDVTAMMDRHRPSSF